MSNVLQSPDETALERIRRWPTPRSKLWTAKFLGAARLDDNLVAVVAVGSAVRPGVNSVDLDLVVIAKDVSKLKEKPPIEVDLRAYPLDQVNSLIGGGTDLLGWAVQYGQVLLQKNAAWDRILREWRDRVPLPLPEVAVKRAAEALRRYTSMLEVGDYDAAYEQAVSHVTHLARAELVKRRVYPASRPELPGQLRAVGSNILAESLERLVTRAVADQDELGRLIFPMSLGRRTATISARSWRSRSASSSMLIHLTGRSISEGLLVS